jgi:hypothetical protein
MGSVASEVAMRSGRLRGDLALLTQGIEVAVTLGVRSLEGLAGVAELIEHSVYEHRSLARTPDGLTFVLRNPPLRMGAFSSIRVLVDGIAIPPEATAFEMGGLARVLMNTVDRDRPVTLPVGERTRVHLQCAPPVGDRVHLRLELQSVAIPPRVWFEFSDTVRGEAGT